MIEEVTEKKLESGTETKESDIFEDIRYICGSSSVITDALQKGFDVAQLPNGDLIITELKVVNVHYVWDKEKQKMVKASHLN